MGRTLLVALIASILVGCSGSQDDGTISQAQIVKAASNPGAQNMIGGEPLARPGQNGAGAPPGNQKFGIGK